MAIQTGQRAPKRLGGLSFDALIDARVDGRIEAELQSLRAEVAELKDERARLPRLIQPLPAALDRHQIAFHLSCSPSTADMLVRTGRLQAVQLPGMAARVVLRDEFIEFLTSGERC